MKYITVVGDGAWGRALGVVAEDAGHRVQFWSRKNPSSTVIDQADALILAVPAQVLGPVLEQITPPISTALIITAKGIERHTGRFMHEVAQSLCPRHPILILSGPSFAEDVSRHLPTAVTMAAATMDDAQYWANVLTRPHFRIYGSDDLLGVAMGGALKNVLAIACGVSDGKALGESARAALIARGFSELTRLGKALGAKPETMTGLSGLGDLLLTCSSPQSRNYGFGKRLGQGASVSEALAAATGVVEGVYSAQAALALARKHAIEMPITATIAAIVEDGLAPDQAIRQLLARPVAAEFM